MKNEAGFAGHLLSSAARRLAEKVRHGSTDDCWEWQGHVSTGGYGVISIGKRRIGTHRLALMLAKGAPPAGKPLALHACDNPPCCNPAHLRWGDTQDNRDDRTSRIIAQNISAQESAHNG